MGSHPYQEIENMKILAAQFISESNEHIHTYTQLEDYEMKYGEQCLDKMNLGQVFQDANIDVIPSIYANSGSGGVISKACFDAIEGHILKDVRAHLQELDGLFLHLHGASEVEGLEGGSGEHHILKMIRLLVGPYLPVAVVCDPHGNLSKEYVEQTTMIRSYRESPHTDIKETTNKVANMLIRHLRKRDPIVTIYRKLPLLLGGEQSVSSDEPVRSINQYMDMLEQDPRILSCSWHVGYIRHDSPHVGCGIVIVARYNRDSNYAQEVADALANYVWDRRHEFHYTGVTCSTKDALEKALAFEGKPVIVSDSGDNVTSGALGQNTMLLERIVKLKDYHHKKILIAGIGDARTTSQLWNHEIGEEVSIKVGTNLDEYSAKIDLDVIIKTKGYIKGCISYGYHNDNYGNMVRVALKDKPVELIVMQQAVHPFVEEQQYLAAGVCLDDFDVIIVKLGYAFPQLKAKGKLCIMAVTPGATYQDTTALPFKRIMRPMYPIDDI